MPVETLRDAFLAIKWAHKALARGNLPAAVKALRGLLRCGLPEGLTATEATLRVSDSDGRSVRLSLQPYREGWLVAVYVPTDADEWRRLGCCWCRTLPEAVALAPQLAAELLDLTIWEARPAQMH